MGKKLLFLDLDGTLLDDDKQISAENHEALQGALSRGHRIVIATGRPLAGALAQNRSLGLVGQGCYLIAFNGGILYEPYTDRIVEQYSLSAADAITAIRIIQSEGIHVQAYTNDRVVVEPSGNLSYVQRYCDVIKMEYQVVEDFSALSPPPCKVLAIDYENRAPLERVKPMIESALPDTVHCFFSCPYYLEILPRGIDKGDAVRRMSRLLGVPIADTIAVGDEHNDLTMLQTAGIGCAMANATDEIKAVADYITQRDNNHSAIAEVVARFLP